MAVSTTERNPTAQDPSLDERADVGLDAPVAPAAKRSAPTKERARGRRKRGRSVAPFVAPSRRLARRSRRDLRKQGFVALSQERPKLRHRILPRTLIGICLFILAIGLGAGFAGASFYAYYDNRLAESEAAIEEFVGGFDQQFVEATDAIDAISAEATADLDSQLGPFRRFVVDAAAVSELNVAAAPSVWFVETLDENGRPAVGSAFVVASDGGGSLLLTSYSTVADANSRPGPEIFLTSPNDRIPALLHSVDQANDVALLVVERPNMPVLKWASDQTIAEVTGSRIFALSGLGGAGATSVPGFLVDSSAIGFQHTATIGTAFQGGPLVTASGEVLGVASLNYQPLGFDPGDVRFAPSVRNSCSVVLTCSEIDRVMADVAGLSFPSAPEPAPAEGE